MRIVIFIFTLHIYLFANIFDDINLFKAQVAFKNKNYTQSFEAYKKIEYKSDEVYYNMANILYRQKKYTEAIEYYLKINSEKLNYKKLHNIGNCYIGLEKLDIAVSFYKSALKYKRNKETLFNLELAKKIQKKIEEEESKELQEEKEVELEAVIKSRDSLGIINEFTDDNIEDEINSRDENSTIIQRNDNISNIKSQNEKEYIQNVVYDDTNKTKMYGNTVVEFSDIEEKKWDKVLNSRKLNSLLIPLDNKEMQNEKYPW